MSHWQESRFTTKDGSGLTVLESHLATLDTIEIWASQIHPHLQHTDAYPTVRELVLRMREDSEVGDFLVAHSLHRGDAILAFGEVEGALKGHNSLRLFVELGVTWGPSTSAYRQAEAGVSTQAAPPRWTNAVGAIVMHEATEVGGTVFVKRYPGDTRRSDFFTTELGMSPVPAYPNLLGATSEKLLSVIDDNFGIELA